VEALVADKYDGHEISGYVLCGKGDTCGGVQPKDPPNASDQIYCDALSDCTDQASCRCRLFERADNATAMRYPVYPQPTREKPHRAKANMKYVCICTKISTKLEHAILLYDVGRLLLDLSRIVGEEYLPASAPEVSSELAERSS
jgi:hypothetical protein